MRLLPRPTAIMLFMRTRGLAPRSPAWRAGGLLLTHARMRHPRVARGPTTWRVVVLLLHQCRACRLPDSNRDRRVEDPTCLPLHHSGVPPAGFEPAADRRKPSMFAVTRPRCQEDPACLGNVRRVDARRRRRGAGRLVPPEPRPGGGARGG